MHLEPNEVTNLPCTHHKLAQLKLGTSCHFLPYNILLYDYPNRLHCNGQNSCKFQNGLLNLFQKIEAHTSFKTNMFKTCNHIIFSFLSRYFQHCITHFNWLSFELCFWVLVVGNQTTIIWLIAINLTINNMNFKSPDGECEPTLDIYIQGFSNGLKKAQFGQYLLSTLLSPKFWGLVGIHLPKWKSIWECLEFILPHMWECAWVKHGMVLGLVMH